MRRYCVRRNPATGRWVMFYREPRAGQRPMYRIMGDADTLASAIEGIYE